MIHLQNVLVATDFSAASEAALIYGRALADRFGATLHVLHVTENMFMRPVVGDPRTFEEAAVNRVDAHLTDADRARGARVAVEMSDDPAEAIVRYSNAAGIDLIITGTHGRTGVAHALLGSVAEHVVRRASCPVLTVKYAERELVAAANARVAAVLA